MNRIQLSVRTVVFVTLSLVPSSTYHDCRDMPVAVTRGRSIPMKKNRVEDSKVELLHSLMLLRVGFSGVVE